MKYDSLSKELTERIEYDRMMGTNPNFAFKESDAIRRREGHDKPSVWRGAFVRDVDKILHSAYYSRFADKTQVFSFYRNDDISRRALHVQLVSRIARTIGATLNLNLDLIEAIALGHDMGHTPFGHAGEKYLDELYYASVGKHFAHNVHSVRVLDGIYPYNLTLQTLNGIIAHNGEMECEKYVPKALKGFDELDSQLEMCYTDSSFPAKIMPATLEGCVVRISDIIAYLGKDRQDAIKAGLISADEEFAYGGGAIGSHNAEIINNLSVNIIENSYGKPYIKMSPEYFKALREAKKSNYYRIYLSEDVARPQNEVIQPMFERLYRRLVQDVKDGNKSSPVFAHHIIPVDSSFYKRDFPYAETDADTIVCDYIASMTDDYFVWLYGYLFPGLPTIEYKGYENC